MTPDDIAGFYAARGELDPRDYIELDFDFECAGDPREAAAHLCSEQSTAQWRRVGVDEDFRPRFAARVLSLDAAPRPNGFSIAVGGIGGAAVHACRVTIAHPHGNFGPRLPNLLSAVCGEGAFFSPGIPLIRLQDIRFPDNYLAAFQGPQFGIAGLREQLQAFDRPIFFGVIKPNIGLPAAPFAELGYQSWLGGLDIAKDDEMLADIPWCPLAERAAALGDARRRAERDTGTRKIYLANITDEVDRLVELHSLAVGHGANALLLNAMPVGLSGVRMLRKHAAVPLIAHFPMIAAFSRLPGYGIHSRVFTRLQRLAGFDEASKKNAALWGKDLDAASADFATGNLYALDWLLARAHPPQEQAAAFARFALFVHGRAWIGGRCLDVSKIATDLDAPPKVETCN